MHDYYFLHNTNTDAYFHHEQVSYYDSTTFLVTCTLKYTILVPTYGSYMYGMVSTCTFFVHVSSKLHACNK